MSTLLSLTASQPQEHLSPGDVLITAGATDGGMFVLEAGELVVSRDGVELARLTTPGTMVGEMAVLLGNPASATVRAGTAATVRSLRNARAVLENEPRLAFYVASVLAGRLDATSALLVELSRQESAGSGKPAGILSRILKAIHESDQAMIERPELFSSTMMWPLI